MSPGFTSAPMRMMPASSRSLRASSPTFGMSRVISSLPELGVAGDALELLDVDRGEEVLLDQRSEIRIESSKL
jgi:2-keto-3-deoxy-galactonokinase